MHDWSHFLPLINATLAAITITARIILALLAARHRRTTRAYHRPRTAEQAAPDTAPILSSDAMSRSISVASQLGQNLSVALTMLEWLHHSGLL
jgi:hypothetical protein